jgi:hypothetical protein
MTFADTEVLGIGRGRRAVTVGLRQPARGLVAAAARPDLEHITAAAKAPAGSQ